MPTTVSTTNTPPDVGPPTGPVPASPLSLLHALVKSAKTIPGDVWLIAALAVGMRLVVAITTHFTNEDFLITLRYAENIAHGRGFVYNLSERVLGTTTPLYTLFLAGVTALGLPAAVCGKAVNIVADGLLCLVAYRWLASQQRENAGRILAFFLAVNPLTLRWAISGMETSLVTLCGTAVWGAYTDRRYRLAYGLLGVLFLLRWDSALLMTLLTAAILWRERRLPAAELLLYLALITPWLVFATAYFGSPIPVTSAAKMTVYGWRYRAEFLPLWPKLRFRFIGTPLYLIITLTAMIGVWRVLRERLAMFVPALCWFLLYWIAFLLSKILLFEWYIPPTLPVYGLLFALGLDDLRTWLSRRWDRTALGPVLNAVSTRRVVAGLAGVGISVYMTLLMVNVSRETQGIEDHLRIPLGLWLRANSAPTDRIMLEPIGYIGYYSQRPVLDVIGLTHPKVLPFYRVGVVAPWLEIAETFKPEWCVLRPGELQHILDGARAKGHHWEEEYTCVRTVSFSPRIGREPETFSVYRRNGLAARPPDVLQK